MAGHGTNTVVLKKSISDSEAMAMVEQKKTSPFRSLLSRPKREDVHIHSLTLHYECILTVSGRYVADYYRKATHTISVDHNVRDVALGDGTFAVRPKSRLKSLSGRRSKNKVDMNLEEHVFLEEEGTLHFDHHGKQTKFPFKTDSGAVENYPKKILEKNRQNVREPEITDEAAVAKLQITLKKPLESEVRDLSDEFVLRSMRKTYVPVFEARLVGPKKKIGIIRIDAVRKKAV